MSSAFGKASGDYYPPVEIPRAKLARRGAGELDDYADAAAYRGEVRACATDT
jgi:hypothetical protein